LTGETPVPPPSTKFSVLPIYCPHAQVIPAEVLGFAANKLDLPQPLLIAFQPEKDHEVILLIRPKEIQ
jgi:hypothetical protein